MDIERRTRITTLLARVWLIGASVALGGSIALTAFVFATREAGGVWRIFLLLLMFSIAAEIAMHVLSYWRRCDRCSARLFPLVAGLISSVGRIPKVPDYRAPQFLGSYHLGAVIGMALHGTVRCIRCGHMDGAAFDYVVTRPE